ncbi:MAG: 2-oxoisovalerate dehydrogenase [Actinomycetota bacterium]
MTAIDKQTMLSIYRTTQRIRAFDDRARKAIMGGECFFIHYPVRGHEIISAAVGENMTDADYMTATYRGTADEIACGVPLREIWAENMGRLTGGSKGKAGSMHITDVKNGLMLTTCIVGAGLPIATGLGLASKLKKDGRVTVCNFGDGSTNIGAFHEAVNMATVWDLPIVFVCQNNTYSEHTRLSQTTRVTKIVDRAPAYGITAIHADGTDPVDMYNKAKQAFELVRSGKGPVLLEGATFRTLGHVLSDNNEYMDPTELKARTEADPVPKFRQRLIDEGYATAAEVDAIDAEINNEVESTYKQASEDPWPGMEELTNDVYGVPTVPNSEPGRDAPGEKMGFREAINQAMDQAMANDPTVIVMGEDVADSAGGGVFKVTGGLSAKYGDERVRNTPIAEQAIIGAGIGASMAGMKPISEIMFFDFIGVCMDQLTNHAAKLRYMSGGQTPIPMVVRVGMVGGQPIGAQHSQSLESWLMHSPGIKIAYPSTAYDAKGLMAACIEDPDPCVFVECTMLYANKDNVPQEYYTIPLGKAAIRRPGSDVTIVTYGRYVASSLKAAEELEKQGVSAEVIDLRTLAPLDMETVLTSVAKTKRAVVVHEAARTCGPAAEIATRIHEELHASLRGPVKRVTGGDSPVPTSFPLLAAWYPSVEAIVAAAL